MKLYGTLTVLGLLVPALTIPVAAQAAEMVEFRRGQPEALPWWHLKEFVAEFLEPRRTGLGASVGALLWREIFTANSDMEAGHLFARMDDSQRVIGMLERDYHEAASAIAREQGADMALWGAVYEENADIYIDSYLTLLQRKEADRFSLRWKTGDVVLVAKIPRHRLNFAPAVTTREKLFHRWVVTNAIVPLYAEPTSTGDSVEQMQADTRLEAVAMVYDWFKVRTSNGFAFVRSEDVWVPPVRVRMGGWAELMWEPGQELPLGTAPRHVKGSYQVIGWRALGDRSVWYQVEQDERRGWVDAQYVQPEFSLPAAAFVAATMRMLGGQYLLAAETFMSFSSMPGVDEDPASLATAYQLEGLCRLLAGRGNTPEAIMDPFSRAVTLTPYDPAALNLRALATFAVSKRLMPAVTDLRRAIELDPFGSPTARLVIDLRRATERGGEAVDQLEFRKSLDYLLDAMPPEMRPAAQ